MAIRAKLVIIVFIFAILPMFLLAARWSRTSIAGLTGALRVGLNKRADDITRNIDQAFRSRVGEMEALADSELMKSYARALNQAPASLPDTPTRERLGAFMLSHRGLYSSLICVNREGRALFRVDNGTEADGSPRAFFCRQRVSRQ